MNFKNDQATWRSFLLSISVTLCFSLLLTSCASLKNTSQVSEDDEVLEESSELVSEFDIPMIVNPTVEKWLDYFQGRGHDQFALYLERSYKYIPMMQAILRQHGLPEDLVYLSMIESGFNPYAYSRSRASGPWQFMSATGKKYGLKVDEWRDERRDPEKSTLAAARYLKDLYDRFDDWYLAAASYNAGEGKIQRAIYRYDTKNFWEMSRHRYLKSETKNYVPKLIAAAMISKNPEAYGFRDLQYEDPLQHDQVLVDKMIDLRVVARLVGTSYKEIKLLNPALKLWLTPPNESYTLNIPSGTAAEFLEDYYDLGDEERLASRKIHMVKDGETLEQIAKKYDLYASHVRVTNGLSPKAKLQEGQSLFIPRAAPHGEKWEFRDPSEFQVYIVKRGDSLSTIAKKHRVSVSKIRQWNPHLGSKGLIRAGQKIHLNVRG